MRAGIVTVGTELLNGIGLDTNTALVASRLGDLGVDVDCSLSVPDTASAIADAVLFAADKRQLVIVCGGLGPTFDDVTREGVARAFRLSLSPDEAQGRWLAARYEAMGRVPPDFAMRQADRLSGARFLAATTGTAPGQVLEKGHILVALLPGVPAELSTMLEEELVRMLKEQFGLVDARRIRRIRCTGISESEVQVRIEPVRLAHGGFEFAILAYIEEIDVVIREREARRQAVRVERVAAEAEEALGDVVFGKDDQTLEAAVVGLLAAADLTLATAESCTGGLIAKRLTDIAGSSSVFRGGVVAYSDEAKHDWLSVPGQDLEDYGAVSSPVASQMAANVRLSRRTTYGLAVTGIAGPTGGATDKPVGLVYFALADADDVHTVRRIFVGDRAAIRQRASMVGLDLVRKAVSGHISGENGS